MKFEDVLPYLKEGKVIKRNKWVIYICIYKGNVYIGTDYRNNSYTLYHLESEDILADDWELYEQLKPKVKYYPAIYKNNKENFYQVYPWNRFKNNNDAIKFFIADKNDSWKIDCEFLRLITGIPELIEEREE